MENNRDIKEVLKFRNDISPFLIHLTKDDGFSSAEEKLKNIFKEGLKKGTGYASSMRFASGCYANIDKFQKYLSAISFTETPLNEIHSMLSLSSRDVNMQPYGIVFIKENLIKKGVSPVFYLNTYYEKEKVKEIIDDLWVLIDQKPETAKRLFPLIRTFGEQFFNEKADDFLWEREWRYSHEDTFPIEKEDVFVGLCPDDKIADFERDCPGYKFVDPRKNMKMYATKLIELRVEKGLKCSVI